MKTQKLLPIILMIVSGILFTTSCKKEDDITVNDELSAETIALVEESTTTEMIEAGINSTISEAITYSEKQTSAEKSATISDCMDITIKPTFGFPKTITVDFGDGCTGISGFTLSGSMSITISDTLRTKGTTYEVAFNNFAIEGYSVSGEISVENTNNGEVPSFYQEIELTLTSANGVAINKLKTVERAWIEGSETDDISDDVFSVSGSADVNSSEGGYYSYNITEPLIISYSCDFISEGVMEITTTGSDEPVIIDFGNGGCDREVYVSQGNIENVEINVNN